MSDHLGKQLMVEVYGCETKLLDDPVFIENCMVEAAKIANATVVQQFFHQFSPYGVSGTVVIAESHINIHTWPEYAYAAIDIFTCGPTLDAQAAIDFLQKKLNASKVNIQEYLRGDKREINTINA